MKVKARAIVLGEPQPWSEIPADDDYKDRPAIEALLATSAELVTVEYEHFAVEYREVR